MSADEPSDEVLKFLVWLYRSPVGVIAYEDEWSEEWRWLPDDQLADLVAAYREGKPRRLRFGKREY